MSIYQVLLAALFPLIIVMYVLLTAAVAGACFALLASVQYLRRLSNKTLFTIGGSRPAVASDLSKIAAQGI